MKKCFFILAVLLGVSSVTVFAQYDPTQQDLGKDCTTQTGKLGKWTSVTNIETTTDANTQGTNNTRTSNTGVGANAGASVGASAGTKSNNVSGSVNGGISASHNRSNATTSSNSNTKTTTTTRQYETIECIEDKNANLPQRSPVRW